MKANLKPLPPDWLENYCTQFHRTGICICSVKGDCLEPRVMDGDWLAIDQNRSPRNGDVVMVKVGARREKMVKVYWCENGRVTLRTLNPGHEDLLIKDTTPFEVLGVAFRVVARDVH